MERKYNSEIPSSGRGLWQYLPSWSIEPLKAMRIEHPIGWWLLILPSWIAIPHVARLAGAPWWMVLKMMVLFLIGGIVMRGAGCAINDLWDKDIDGHVARTRDRPLAAGRMNVIETLKLIAVLMIIGFLILIMLPTKALVVGLVSIPLIIIYPLTKRIMHYPQLVLGLTFSWGVLLGWSAFGVWPDFRAILLYLAMVCWVFGYDTIYAIQDREDDLAVGVRSSAISFGTSLHSAVSIAYALSIIFLVFFSSFSGGDWGFALAIALAGIHFYWQVYCLRDADGAMAGKLFKSNRDVGLILTFGALVNYIF